MLYTNLFKTNISSKSKMSVYYLVESRKYKINEIFDKRLVSTISAIAIGSFMIGSVNFSIYWFATVKNADKLSDLEMQNNSYLGSLTMLEGLQSDYLNQKSNADNIYNISTKHTKWSSIVDSIAKQLPYDSVLTSITTLNSEEILETQENEDSSINLENGEGNENKEPTLEEQIATNESLIENDVIEITGKSLSMVNLTLFLDKLDKLDIFSKVECLSAEKETEAVYYDFLIHAYLN